MVNIYPQIGGIGDPLREMAEEEYHMDHSSGGGDLIPDMGPYGIFIPLSIIVACCIIFLILIRFKVNLFTQILTGILIAVFMASGVWVSIELINLMS